jgi:hypothetical protein
MITLGIHEPPSRSPGLSAWVREGPPRPVAARPTEPRLLDPVRESIRLRHDSRRTEKTDISWIPRDVVFQETRHPRDMGKAEVGAFLSHLATECRVSASTQNQALSALLFLHAKVLVRGIGWVDEVVRTKRPARLPVVLTREEVVRVLAGLDGVTRLMASLLYGAGLRLLECCHLRIKDVDLERREILVRSGKGARDRTTLLPIRLVPDLAAQIERVRAQHAKDLEAGAGSVELPTALARKYPPGALLAGVAVGVPGEAALCRPDHPTARTAPPARDLAPARNEGRCSPGQDPQGGHLPLAPPLVRHPPARGRLRHSDHPGAAGPSRLQHDHDLHPSAPSGRTRCSEPAGWRAAVMPRPVGPRYLAEFLRSNRIRRARWGP